jgi:hypothetical protein
MIQTLPIALSLVLITSTSSGAPPDSSAGPDAEFARLLKPARNQPGQPCNAVFPDAYLYIGKTTQDQESLMNLIWQGQRKPGATPTSAQDAIDWHARCYASGPHKTLNLDNWCCMKPVADPKMTYRQALEQSEKLTQGMSAAEALEVMGAPSATNGPIWTWDFSGLDGFPGLPPKAGPATFPSVSVTIKKGIVKRIHKARLPAGRHRSTR